MFDLQNEGQGHRVQLSQWSYSMANIKVKPEHFRQLSQFSRYSHFKMRDQENIGQGHNV